jgi:hypothetical protein
MPAALRQIAYTPLHSFSFSLDDYFEGFIKKRVKKCVKFLFITAAFKSIVILREKNLPDIAIRQA